MLKSAPLKSTFPLSPPRTSPSPAPLLASIRSLIQSGNLVDPVWQSTTTWRSQIRKAFASYHALMRQVAEEIVSDRSFAEEYFIFLENVSRPVQLLQLIADDFEAEFGPNATRGLLGVGDVGGDNLISIMDFCAAKKPSELLKRVKQRVAEKQERDRRSMQFESLRERLKELDAKVKSWLLKYRSAIGKKDKGEGEGEEDVEGDGEQVDVVYEEDAVRLQRELEETLDERDKIKSELDDLQAKQEEDERAVKRERAERQKLRRAAGVDEETGEAGFKLGSSKDLLVPTAAGDVALDPFSSVAPRAVSPVPGSAKGKARALTQPGKVRGRPSSALAQPLLTLFVHSSPAPPLDTPRLRLLTGTTPLSTVSPKTPLAQPLPPSLLLRHLTPPALLHLPLGLEPRSARLPLLQPLDRLPAPLLELAKLELAGRSFQSGKLRARRRLRTMGTASCAVRCAGRRRRRWRSRTALRRSSSQRRASR